MAQKTTDTPMITVLVCIRQGYARDQQFYAGNNFDTLHDQEESGNWFDVEGSIGVFISESESVEAAITQVAEFYGCSSEIFEGYQIAKEAECS